MSLIIKGMEMPRSCDDCILRFLNFPNPQMICKVTSKDVTNQQYAKERHPDCPLEPISLLPGHGKIIDAAELIQQIEAYDYWVTPENSAIAEKGMLTIDIKQTIAFTPTVIEAERNDYEIT